MGHLTQIERMLRSLLREGNENAVVRFVLDSVLESYRNGLSRKGEKATGDDKRPQSKFTKKPQRDYRKNHGN